MTISRTWLFAINQIRIVLERL